MIAFLESAGWAPDGAARAVDVDDMLVPQIRFRTSLAAPPEDTPPEGAPVEDAPA